MSKIWVLYMGDVHGIHNIKFFHADNTSQVGAYIKANLEDLWPFIKRIGSNNEGGGEIHKFIHKLMDNEEEEDIPTKSKDFYLKKLKKFLDKKDNAEIVKMFDSYDGSREVDVVHLQELKSDSYDFVSCE